MELAEKLYNAYASTFWRNGRHEIRTLWHELRAEEVQRWKAVAVCAEVEYANRTGSRVAQYLDHSANT